MRELKSLWKENKKKCNKLESSLVDSCIAFLRQIAKVYLKEGRRVFFRENRAVHWGEGNFGQLMIEGKEEVSEVFGEYISEIHFEPELDEKVIEGYIQITQKNLKDIKYAL
jgi:hypothetical protein